MLFNSPDYLIFLTIVFFGFWTLRRIRFWRIIFLVAASCFFYMAWNRDLILLIIVSTVVDWVAGNVIYRSHTPKIRRLFLGISVLTNLGLLALFKYTDFFISSTNQITSWLGRPADLHLLHLLLPVGISFYTFQTMSYTIDIYRGELKPARNPREFFLFVIFFPQLVAGPIVRARDFLPQLDREPTPESSQGLVGLFRIAVGLIKKVALADYLAVNLIDRVFERPELFSGLEVLVGVYAYAFQIYLDFSAYSDIAIGSGMLLGFVLPENFNVPYRARNLQEFWHRWHISLSTWLRDYLYIPLGGSRSGRVRTYRNLMLTMLLGGLWHGAAWTFVFWGALHGGGLVLTRIWQRWSHRPPLPTWLAPPTTFLTFHYVCLAWIFFRAPTFEGAWGMLKQISGATLDHANLAPTVLLALVVAAITHWIPQNWEELAVQVFVNLPAPARAGLLLLTAIALKQVASSEVVPFIYFQF